MRKVITSILLALMLFSMVSPYLSLEVFASESPIKNEEPLDADPVIETIADFASQDVPVTDLDIEDVQSPMTVKTSQILSVTVIPADATDKKITYTSQTPEIATVNALGRVGALAPGTAIIEIGAGEVTRLISIVVEQPQAKATVFVSSIDVDYEDTMTEGAIQTLLPSVLPATATSQISYYSSNTRIATVNDFGKVTAVSAGTTTITVSADGVRKSITITVIEKVKVTEIDLNDVQTEMTIGTSQTISVNIFPADAVDQTIEYASSNNRILTVNSFGRVNAVGLGSASITVYVDSIKKTITIDVVEEVIPKDIDFDMLETKINVGSSISIGATVLPTNAVDKTIAYTSSDMSILTVNELGRVKGISLGMATVTLKAGNIQKSIAFEVVAEDVVTTIEVSEFNEKMKIEDTQTISASLYPANAKEQKITYSSSNPEIAKVSEGGIVTAVGKGDVTITLSVGVAVKELEITVYVATEKIDVPDSYLIMQPSNSQRIFASASPMGADQKLTYRSTNENTATVSANGTVTALSPGRASIIISNFDNMKAVTVIVNEGSASSAMINETVDPNSTWDQSDSQRLVALIQEAEDGGSINVSGDEYALVTSDVLRALYQSSKSINIFCDGYMMRIRGVNIKNAENALFTDISLSKTDTGLSFVINDRKNLPGAIEIEFLNLGSDYRYLYLFSDATQKYERLNSFNNTTAKISLAGAYVLSISKLDGVSFGVYIIIGVAILIAVCAVVYILIRKKHWFW